VNVAVDPARQSQQPCRVNLARRAVDMIGDADDVAVTNADIGAKLVAGRHDGAAADGEIELCHRGLRHLMAPCFENSAGRASPRLCVSAAATRPNCSD
jgi:hypothetical protein